MVTLLGLLGAGVAAVWFVRGIRKVLSGPDMRQSGVKDLLSGVTTLVGVSGFFLFGVGRDATLNQFLAYLTVLALLVIVDVILSLWERRSGGSE